MTTDTRPSGSVRLTLAAIFVVFLAACGGGGGGSGTPSASTGDDTVLPGGDTGTTTGGGGSTTGDYTIGGRVLGLTDGESVVLQNNGGDNITVNADGPFIFSEGLSFLETYDVTVLNQPDNGQVCAVINDSGTGYASSSIDTVRVSCASVFTMAGSAGGLGNAVGEEAVFARPSGIAIDGGNNLYVTDSYNNTIRKIAPDGTVTTLAGAVPSGYVDDSGDSARFRLYTTGGGIVGVAVDTSGTLYVADIGNDAIRKITPTGVVSTLAGGTSAGYADGWGTAAKFEAPQGIAVDSAGNVYVADTGNGRIRKITPEGEVTTLAGSGGYSATDGVGTEASFNYPTGLAIDGAGNLYVTDYNRVRKITPEGVVTTLAGSLYGNSGDTDATGTDARFDSPYAVAVNSAGHVYVSDSGNGEVRVITPEGVVSTLAGGPGLSYADGPATTARFYNLAGIAVDADNNVYLADSGNNRIRKVMAAPYEYTVGGYMIGLGNGASLVLQNNAGEDLTVDGDGFFRFATPLSTDEPYDVTVAIPPAGQTCTDTNGAGSFTTGNIRDIKINCATVSTFAGSGTAGYVDGTGTAAQFDFASLLSVDNNGLALDVSGNLYVADTNNHVIRKVTPGGVVSTVAGSGAEGTTDGTGTAAQFDSPRGLAVDPDGVLYVADTGNSRIRKITPAGEVTTLAGSSWGFKDGVGTAAQFTLPRGIAADSGGNLYVTDETNDAIRKITPTGEVTTLAFGWGYTNGSIDSARFRDPTGIAVDSADNVYVGDMNNTIRKISPAGVVSTLAGIQEPYSNSDYVDSTGTAARFRAPVAVAVDAAGTVYVADYNNNAVRMVSPGGVVTTLAGENMAGDYVEGNGVDARFDGPGAIAVDPAGTVYVIDSGNNVIRKITR